MKRANQQFGLCAVFAFFIFSLGLPGFASGFYDIYAPPLPPPPFFGDGPGYYNDFAGGLGFSWINLPSPGLVVNTPRGPVRIDSLPNGTPPTGGIIGVEAGGSGGVRVVTPYGSDDRIRVLQDFFAFTPGPVNGISFEAGIIDDIVSPDFVGGDITFTFDDGFSQTINFPAGTPSFVGFVKTSGPDIEFVTISSSTGLPFIRSIGIGTVPEPASLGAVILAGAALLARRRRWATSV